MYWWAGLASHAPRLANFFTQTPGLRAVVKAAATMAPERRVPLFATQTFREWFRRRPARNADKPPVLLWPDTWNNHFHPETAQAAVEALEDAGFRVTIPSVRLCCGRPLYDHGMLDLAKSLLGQILEALRPQIRAGIPIVGLEPSCVSVFRDELAGLLPDDADAELLGTQTYLFTEFLARRAPGYRPPPLPRKAVIHEHCHDKALLDRGAGGRLFDALRLDYRVLDSGCCGMAGAFGFERGEHYDVSIRAGERVLLPAVRRADTETLIVANGFSCREQIAQTTARQALHPAQLVKMALDARGHPSDGAYPERQQQPDPAAIRRRIARQGVAVVATLLATAAAAVVLRRRTRTS
jgi:Fe-S oxidoreductase